MNATVAHSKDTALERSTPQIDTQSVCQCNRPLAYDEVFGWLHLYDGSPHLGRPHVPRPSATGTQR